MQRRTAAVLFILCLLMLFSFSLFAAATHRVQGGEGSEKTQGNTLTHLQRDRSRIAPLKTERPEKIADEQAPYAQDFSDAAFLGDSRTEGLMLNTGLYTADFFTGVGLMVNEVDSKEIVPQPDGSKITALEALSRKTYRRVYVMFGVNELGWVSTDLFRQAYVELIQDIQALQPQAEIFVQTIFPVSREKSQKDSVYNNTNVVRFNQEVRAAAEETGATLVETALLFDDGAGNLPADATTDGVHLTAAYYQQWLDYLREVS